MSNDTSEREDFPRCDRGSTMAIVCPALCKLELTLGALRVQLIKQHTVEVERAAQEFQAKTNLRD